MNAEFTVMLRYPDDGGYFVEHVTVRPKPTESEDEVLQRAIDKALKSCASGNGETLAYTKDVMAVTAVFEGHCKWRYGET